MIEDDWYDGGECLTMTNGLPNGMASFEGYLVCGLAVFDDGDVWF